MADKLAVLRGLNTKEGDHGRGTYLMRTGQRPMSVINYPSVAAALVLAGLAMAVLNERQVRAQQLRGVTVQAEILAGSVAAALAFDDRATLQEYVGALRANREVAAVGVYDAEGRLTAGYANPGAGKLPATSRVRPPAPTAE